MNSIKLTKVRQSHDAQQIVVYWKVSEKNTSRLLLLEHPKIYLFGLCKPMNFCATTAICRAPIELGTL